MDHPRKPSPPSGDPRHIFFDQVRQVPDLTLRAKALAALHGDRSLTALLGGESVASNRYPLEGFSPWRAERVAASAPASGVRWRARMAEDGLVNRTR